MAMMKCAECGRDYSDRAKQCPECGNPNVQQWSSPMSKGRLAIGIISIVLFFLVSLQSCAAGLSNALTENGATSGTNGAMTGFCLLIAGIVGICTRNGKGKSGPIIAVIFYWLGALMTVGTGETYADLPIWGMISFMFGVVFLVCAVKTKKKAA